MTGPGPQASGSAAPSLDDPAVVAAIVAAVDAAWPRVVVGGPSGDELPEPSSWRFSGRWWSRPVLARRVRPW